MTPTLPADLPANTIFHVGISGGKDSAAALIWLVRESGISHDKIRASFSDTGNEHEWTYAHIDLLSRTVFPVETIRPERDYWQLAMHKKRFPGAKTRFCTQFLKIYPSQDYIQKLRAEGFDPVGVSGVRADESLERRDLPEWDYSGTLLCKSWRPLIAWTFDDVVALHTKHGVPMNPLYALGAQRVGCFPCIMSRKAEIRMIALQFPERIDMIRDKELEFERVHGRFSGFFPRKVIPERFWSRSYYDKGVQKMEDIFEQQGVDLAGEPNMVKVGEKPMLVATIDDVVRWSMTGDRARGSYLDNPETEPVSCNSGFCE